MNELPSSTRTLADIALLYELSLAAGTSLDLRTNCRRFLTTLMARKNLSFAGVWLAREDWGETPGGGDPPYRLAFGLPEIRVRAQELPPSHGLLLRLERAGRAFASEPDAEELVSLFDLDPSGSAAVFPLGPRGILALGSPRPGTFSAQRELRQLEGVVEKFAVSVEGCEAHARVVRAMQERHDAEEARARIQEELHHAQKLEAVGRLAGGIAHDFNNVLTGILGCAELLQAGATDETQAKLLDVVVNAAHNAAELTGQLLTFGRRALTQRHAVDLDRLVTDVAALLRRTVDPRIEIQLQVGIGDGLVVMGDPSQLQSALLNLGVNARDAIEGNGTIRITSERVEITEAATGRGGAPSTPGIYGRVRVADSGQGMDDAVRARIFEPFFSTKGVGRGTGLGLAAVYGAVSGHDGSIAVHSEPGKGTRFDVLLPLVPAPEADDAPDGVAREGRGRVLVIDDDARARDASVYMAQHLGYEVDAVDGGAEGLTRIAAADPPFAAVLLDVRMAGLGGRETLRELRRHAKELPVVVVTGFVDERELAEIRQLGIQGLLAKPFTLAELSTELAAAIGETEAGEREPPR